MNCKFGSLPLKIKASLLKIKLFYGLLRYSRRAISARATIIAIETNTPEK